MYHNQYIYELKTSKELRYLCEYYRTLLFVYIYRNLNAQI